MTFPDPSTTKEISVNDTVTLIEDGEESFLLIDCREPNEHEFCRIESAKLIPMNQTPERVAELETHRDSQIVVHCHHGGRSLQVVQWLRNEGFHGAQNMTGGIEAWSQTVDPEVPRY